MKKKYIVFLFALIIFLAGTVLFKSFLGARPFRNLETSEITSASVRAIPPDVTVDMDDDEIRKLVDILHTVKIYHPDDSYSDYTGQAVMFTITKTDGSQITIQAHNPFLVIDHIGYQAKYEPCENLSALGNEIINTRK